MLFELVIVYTKALQKIEATLIRWKFQTTIKEGFYLFYD